MRRRWSRFPCCRRVRNAQAEKNVHINLGLVNLRLYRLEEAASHFACAAEREGSEDGRIRPSHHVRLGIIWVDALA